MLGTSWRLKKSQLDKCARNGVSSLIEIKIGFDAVAIAQPQAGAALNVTLAQVFLALAEQVPGPDVRLVPNPHKTWSDIDPSLPNLAKLKWSARPSLGPPAMPSRLSSWLRVLSRSRPCRL